MKNQKMWMGVIGVILLSCICLVFLLGFGMMPRRGVAPSVKIVIPAQGTVLSDQATVPVHVEASITTGHLRRVQLFADAQLIGAMPLATTNTQALWSWVPLSSGDHTLLAQAVSDAGQIANHSVRIQVVVAEDQDGDGMPNETDRCPDQPGVFEQQGCPTTTDADRDGDLMPDESDRCPDVSGLIELSGCPMPSDRDGDGIPDGDDACPDEPGPAEGDGCPSITPSDRDGDGLVDSLDTCPDESGTLDSGGCPPVVVGDRDGDGVPDDRDSCPDIPGDVAHDGCPLITDVDSDGDGVPDSEDSCPAEPGPAFRDGCPIYTPALPGPSSLIPFCILFPTLCDVTDSTADSDGDGVPDIDDRCPEESGMASTDGCPMLSISRGAILEARTWICYYIPSACGFDDGEAVTLSIDLWENLYTSSPWLAVWCYFSGDGETWYRLPLEDTSLRTRDGIAWSLGEHHSLTFDTYARRRISVRGFCEAMEMPFGEPASLGQLVRVHGIEDWSGYEFTATSEGAPNTFLVIYRIRCSGCD